MLIGRVPLEIRKVTDWTFGGLGGHPMPAWGGDCSGTDNLGQQIWAGLEWAWHRSLRLSNVARLESS